MSTVGATLLGFVCIEGECWVADGFPTSDMAFFACAVAISLAALAVGNWAPMALGFIGLLFFACVNLRYGAPYLLDYVMPLLYAILAAISRRSLKWTGHAIFKVGWPEALAVVALEAPISLERNMLEELLTRPKIPAQDNPVTHDF